MERKTERLQELREQISMKGKQGQVEALQYDLSERKRHMEEYDTYAS